MEGTAARIVVFEHTVTSGSAHVASDEEEALNVTTFKGFSAVTFSLVLTTSRKPKMGVIDCD